MAEPHALSALKAQREEIAREVRSLKDALIHLDATIGLFERERYQRPTQPHLLPDVFAVLRESGRPVTTGHGLVAAPNLGLKLRPLTAR